MDANDAENRSEAVASAAERLTETRACALVMTIVERENGTLGLDMSARTGRCSQENEDAIVEFLRASMAAVQDLAKMLGRQVDHYERERRTPVGQA